MKTPGKKLAAKKPPAKVVAKTSAKVAAKGGSSGKAAAKKAAAGGNGAAALSDYAKPAAAGALVLDRLHATITERRGADPATSHSARLLSRGMAKVAQKFGEESVECLIEAVAGHPTELVAESADVLYHLLVMWVAAGIEPASVWAELARREGVSGIAEKAARRPLGTTKIP